MGDIDIIHEPPLTASSSLCLYGDGTPDEEEHSKACRKIETSSRH